MATKYKYDKDTDYAALMEQTARRGDNATAAVYEQQRNAKIRGEGMAGQEQTSDYAQYLPIEDVPDYDDTHRREAEALLTGRGTADRREQIDRMLDALLGEQFDYDPASDKLYAAYRQQYERQAELTAETALGTAAAWHVTAPLYGHAEAAAALTYPLWVQAIATFVACFGFVILYNVNDWGRIMCAVGSARTWFVDRLCSRAGHTVYSANFFSEVVAAFYSEAMGRWRKCPVTSYLVISSIPLLPGAGIYYTMSIGLSGAVQEALQKGLETAGIAGSLAVGIQLVSTVFRVMNVRKRRLTSGRT